jgi:hypothetical protein
LLAILVAASGNLDHANASLAGRDRVVPLAAFILNCLAMTQHLGLALYQWLWRLRTLNLIATNVDRPDYEDILERS